MMQRIFQIINSAKGVFVYGILTKWYLAIAIPAMGITYIIFKKLDEKGVFDIILSEITKHLEMLERVAQKCTPKIIEGLPGFIECLDRVN